MGNGRSIPFEHRFAIGIVLSLCIALTAFVNWSRPLIETHTFRQTQTALTAYYFAHEEMRLLHPQLPVFGARFPSIPIEFPIYQALAALGARWLPGDSAVTGITVWCRVVSALHFFLCGIVGYWLLIRLAEKPIAIGWLLLWYLTPFSLYWGTSAMIESTALFYALSSSLLFITLINTTTSTKYLGIGLPLLFVLATLAFLTKVTTMLIFCPSLAIVTLVTVWKRRSERSQLIGTLLVGALGLLIPLLVGYLWVRWGDAVKSENLIGGAGLVSTRLRDWNFGTLALRFSPQGWKEFIFDYHIKTVLLGLMALAIPFSWAHFRKRPHLVLLILPALVGPLVFTNLYFRHAYYSVAVLPSVLLLVAMGCGVISRIALVHRVPLSLPMVVLAFLAAGWSILIVHEHLKPADRTLLEANYLLFPYTETSTRLNTETLNEYERVTELTKEKDVLVVFGNDWSAETAFYTQRRTVMIQKFPHSGLDETRLDAIQAERPVAALYYQSVADKIPKEARILYEGTLFTAVTPALAGLESRPSPFSEDPDSAHHGVARLP